MKKELINLWKNSFVIKAITALDNKKFRKKLKNHNFTIICSNCIGGVIYNRLGERFNSPTLNIAIVQKEFCDFINYFDYYLSIEMTDGGLRNDGVPLGILKGDESLIPDITVELVHYRYFEEGKNKWDERKKRVNKDNLYIIMFDTEGVTYEDLKKVENFKCNNKVILTSNPDCNISWSHYIEENKNTQYPKFFMDRDIWGRRNFEKNFDFVEFINKIK